jgi:hypothetical protein
MLQRLLNKYEEETNERLKVLTEHWGAHTFVKVRLADVFRIQASGISDEEYRFALQSHFDFLVTDRNLLPLFAVEYDGYLHSEPAQASRDELKAKLCDRFELPLLRINSRYLLVRTNGLDLLGWFVHAWFSGKVVSEAEAAGHIPPGDVSPLDLVTLPGTTGALPLWLSRSAISEIWEGAKTNPGQDPVPSCIVGKGQHGQARALGWLRLSTSTCISVETGMRAQLFPVPVDEVLEDLVVLELSSKLRAVRKGVETPQSLEALDRQISRFKERYTTLSYTGYGPPQATA